MSKPFGKEGTSMQLKHKAARGPAANRGAA
jgi:hypothetical protein